jgi:flagellin
MTVTINATNAINNTNQSRTIGIKSGGADFSLSPDVSLAGKVSIGLDTITTGNLGNSVTGFLSQLRTGGTANVQNGDLSKAQEIVESAIKQVSTLRGRLGSFSKDVITSSISSLNVAYENIAAAESAVRDTDFASEIATMTRTRILQDASFQALKMSNDSQGLILKLLS